MLRAAGGRRRSGDGFAGEHPQSLGQGHVLLTGDPGQAFAVALLGEGRLQVGGDPGHAFHAQGFAARLLHRIEDLAGGLRLGPLHPVRGLVVVLQAQGDGIRLAAHLRNVRGRKVTRGHRQAHFRARDALTARREGRRDVLAFRDRAQGCSRHALELLDGAFALVHGLCLSPPVRSAASCPAGLIRPSDVAVVSEAAGLSRLRKTPGRLRQTSDALPSCSSLPKQRW